MNPLLFIQSRIVWHRRRFGIIKRSSCRHSLSVVALGISERVLCASKLICAPTEVFGSRRALFHYVIKRVECRSVGVLFLGEKLTAAVSGSVLVAGFISLRCLQNSDCVSLKSFLADCSCLIAVSFCLRIQRKMAHTTLRSYCDLHTMVRRSVDGAMWHYANLLLIN